MKLIRRPDGALDDKRRILRGCCSFASQKRVVAGHGRTRIGKRNGQGAGGQRDKKGGNERYFGEQGIHRRCWERVVCHNAPGWKAKNSKGSGEGPLPTEKTPPEHFMLSIKISSCHNYPTFHAASRSSSLVCPPVWTGTTTEAPRRKHRSKRPAYGRIGEARAFRPEWCPMD